MKTQKEKITAFERGVRIVSEWQSGYDKALADVMKIIDEFDVNEFVTDKVVFVGIMKNKLKAKLHEQKDDGGKA